MQATEQITACLEKSAELLGDITPQVFARFFAQDAEAAALMQHSDPYMQGRMLSQTFELLMSDELLAPDGYLAWEIENHLQAYGAKPSMYAAFFTAIETVLATGMGEQWTAQDKRAWDDRVSQVMAQVSGHIS